MLRLNQRVLASDITSVLEHECGYLSHLGPYRRDLANTLGAGECGSLPIHLCATDHTQ